MVLDKWDVVQGQERKKWKESLEEEKRMNKKEQLDF